MLVMSVTVPVISLFATMQLLGALSVMVVATAGTQDLAAEARGTSPDSGASIPTACRQRQTHLHRHR